MNLVIKYCLIIGAWLLVIMSAPSARATNTATTSATIPSLSAAPDTTAPTIPILISPPDSSFTDNSSPEFVWRQSSDDNSNTVIYTLYLNDVATYLNIGSSDNTLTPTFSTRLEGYTIHLTPTYALPDATYSWYVTARDLSDNSSHSATWHFTLDINPAGSPEANDSRAATITQISRPSYHLSSLIYLLLAIIILLLLAFLWRRRYNLILLNSQFRPFPHATIYHSLPPLASGVYRLTPRDLGRVFIPHLSRYSTLTIRVNPAGPTYILSISRSARLYTIILG